LWIWTNQQAISYPVIKKHPAYGAGCFLESYFFLGLPQQSLNFLPEPQEHLSVGLGVILFTSF
jgi:hypothetical protein